MQLDVVWLALRPEHPKRGYWDQGLLEYIFDKFQRKDYEVETIPDHLDGAVVVIPARHQYKYIDEFNEQLSKLKWCVVILTGDEESVFPVEQLSHPKMVIWVMSPKKGRHEYCNFKLGSGFRCDEPELNRQIGIQKPKLDFFFGGQITHQKRIKMAEQLRDFPNGKLVETSGFGQGLDLREYLTYVAQAKFVPSPAGPVSPDNFRLYETLEAGSVPIGDGGDYWTWLFGEAVPFPIIDDWSNIRRCIDQQLKEWPTLSNRTFAWWQLYKRKIINQLSDDILTISAYKPSMPQESNITVLISSSPIPSHPSSEMIEITIKSIRDRLPNSEIFIMLDGVSPENELFRGQYNQYIRKLLWKLNNEYTNIYPVYFDEFSHQTVMTKRTLDLVRTPLLLFVEHDCPLVHDIPFDKLSEAILDGHTNVIRLHHDYMVLEEHHYLQLDDAVHHIYKNGIQLYRSKQWSQRPHLASTDYYKRICKNHFNILGRPAFIEHCMYGIVCGEFEPWENHKLTIYKPDEGTMLRSTNLNGRLYKVEGINE